MIRRLWAWLTRRSDHAGEVEAMRRRAEDIDRERWASRRRLLELERDLIRSRRWRA